VIAVALLALVGCSSGKKETGSEAEGKGDAKPVVYVSNYPLKYFVERLAAPIVEIRFPAGASDDPAYWKPTPEDIAAMQRADLIVLNGASYEQWLRNVSLPQSRLVDSAAGFSDKFIALDEAVTHSHGLEGKHEHSGTAFTTWMDMALAAEHARAVKDALAARWPDHKGLFEDRFVQLEKDLFALDSDIKAAISAAPELPVVFSHPVYQYFQRRYNVSGKSVHWEPDAVPDEAMVNELQDLLKEHSAKWMLWEGEPLQSISDQLKELGADSAVVDPCGNVPENGDFLSVMQRNVAELRRVFSEPKESAN
ncbi:MAG: zinc ABC transporter substrate-binding protein, partial [Candidatus Hydrogenedentota bacterium]